MTQKRILRANSRKVVRERDLRIRDVFAMYAKDPDDPDISNIISELAHDDPNETALAFFEIANRLVSELSEVTGSTPNEVLDRALRG
jgi:hypothetical protein